MFKLQIAVDVIPMLERKKYKAKCGSSDYRKRVEDFEVEGSNMMDLLTNLVNKIDDLNIPMDSIHIVGEFDEADLSESDLEAWSTPLNEIRKQDSGLNRFIAKLS